MTAQLRMLRSSSTVDYAFELCSDYIIITKEMTYDDLPPIEPINFL